MSIINQEAPPSVSAFRDRVASLSVFWKFILVGIPLLFMLVLFIVSIGIILVMSFWRSQQFQIIVDWNLGNYLNLLTSQSYQTLLGRSLVMALLVTAFSLLIAYPIAYYISRGIKEQQLPILLLFAAPFFVGTMLRESAHQAIVGPSGLANQLLEAIGIGSSSLFGYGLFQVFLGEVYLWFPFMLLSIYLSIELVDETLEEAAVDAGAGPWTTFREVTLPLSMPGITIGCVLVFVSAFVSHVPSRFVGGPSGSLIGNTLKDLFGESGAWPLGSALGVFIILIALLFVGLLGVYTLRTVPTLMGGEQE
jgi:ABC-type spermidine/putrescine transport system permease subunit I